MFEKLAIEEMSAAERIFAQQDTEEGGGVRWLPLSRLFSASDLERWASDIKAKAGLAHGSGVWYSGIDLLAPCQRQSTLAGY